MLDCEGEKGKLLVFSERLDKFEFSPKYQKILAKENLSTNEPEKVSLATRIEKAY
jgi:hypothetical protein